MEKKEINRPIIFNVWNPHMRQMRQAERIFFYEDTVEISHGFTGQDKATWFLEHCTLLQFSGGYDSNDKQIFEGDILECTCEKKYSDTRNGKYICVFNDEFTFGLVTTPFFKQGNHFIGLPIPWSGFVSKKIIGNIFQNLELISDE